MSPKLAQIGSYRFHFYMVDCAERTHVHIYVGGKPGKKQAKYWLSPQVELAWNRGFTTRELGEAESLVRANANYFKAVWNEKCGGTHGSED